MEDKTFYIVHWRNLTHHEGSSYLEFFESSFDVIQWYQGCYVKPTIQKIQRLRGTIEDIPPAKKKIETITYETDWLGALNGQEQTIEGMGRDTEIKEREQEVKERK